MPLMQIARRSFFLLLILFYFASILYAADLNFPYIDSKLRVAPAEDPFPGMGNYYSTLDKGMKSALWNPASLGKLEISEGSVTIIPNYETFNYQRDYSVTESSGPLNFGEGSSTAGGEYGIFYRLPGDIGTGINTREIDVSGHSNYATEGTGINFSSAIKLNDWFTLGFSTNSPFAIEGTIGGDFPVTAKAITDFYGQNFGDMVINDQGKLSYTYTGGGSVATYESTNAVWGGFITQEAFIPLITIMEGTSDVSFQSPYTSTLASKFGNAYVGLNMIPINASANIDNDIRTVISSDTQDIYLYTPDFDPDNETAISDWTSDPNQYASVDGYKRKQINLPAGEIFATGKYRGFYQASTARMDLGAMYDITEWCTVGLVLENIGGSSLNFRGNGIATFLNYREIDTAEAASFDDLIQPGGKDTYDLISDQWISTNEVSGRRLYLEPERTYALPKRLRFGVAFKKPFLIALDVEQNQTPIVVGYGSGNEMNEVTISNINLFRIGMETQLFALPVWLRTGITLLQKPTITGLTTEAQQSVDSAFQMGFVPIKFDFGSDMDLWGTIVGNSFGFNGQSIFSMFQFDTTNLDLSKLVYLNNYVIRDAWKFNYLIAADPVSTFMAYRTKTVAAGSNREFEMSDLRFIQTLGVTYRF